MAGDTYGDWNGTNAGASDLALAMVSAAGSTLWAWQVPADIWTIWVMIGISRGTIGTTYSYCCSMFGHLFVLRAELHQVPYLKSTLESLCT